MDFTINRYKLLLQSFKSTQTFGEYLNETFTCNIVLRHDVDRSPKNALKMAVIEHELGFKATYFFRSHPHVFQHEIIKKIESLGHEIGYHYENLSDFNGDFDKAIQNFSETLEKFRIIANVNTVCMHGSPLSKYNNQDLWKKFNFRDFGIIGEPYFSINFNKVAYVTDAGRKWNDEKVNFRDKVNSTMHFNIRNTNDIIKLINSKEAPSDMMINIHPHNWAFSSAEWGKIYIWQGFKNIIKIILHTLDKRN